MILQTLDIKDNCSGIFHNGSFMFEDLEKIMENCNVAWKHSPMLNDEEYTYLYLLIKSDELGRFCSDQELFDTYRSKIMAHQKAAISAKISLQEECFFDLLPQHQLLKWFQLKDDCLKNISSVNSRAEDYSILHKAHVLTTNISFQDVIYQGNRRRVNYDIFGSATGRLTTKRDSVPVLTLKKEQRADLRPTNDLFVELDLNAAEVRMLMALSGQAQPEQDLHEYLNGRIFNNCISRAKFKERLFAWFYNPSSQDTLFNGFFDRNIFSEFYDYDEEILTTPFGRRLKVEDRKAQNYLLQSTTSDQVIESCYNIQKMLVGTKSRVAFTLHDSVIIDMCKEDAKLLKDLKQEFESTRWGNFKSSCKIGKTFGHLKDLEI